MKQLRAWAVFGLLPLFVASFAVSVRAQEPKSSEPKPATPAASADKTPLAAKPDDKAAPKKSTAMDRLELDSTAITGNRELPKVLYIVPWKKSELGELAGRPTNTLLDEILAPVDREVFRRQVDYFSKLSSETPAAPETAPATPPSGK